MTKIKDPWMWESSWWYENWLPALIMVVGYGGVMALLFMAIFVWVPHG